MSPSRYLGYILSPLTFRPKYSRPPVAQEAGISRQAVHDVLARAESAMEAMEAKIGCVARARRQQKALEIITEAAAALSAMPQAKELAARILSAAETIKE